MPQSRYLFVSDLHLDGSAPDAVAQFIGFLQTDAMQSDGLYILGDLFETWIGEDDDAARRTVCDALRTFTASGKPCWVIRGNRDFLLDAGFERRTGCTLLPDPTLLQLGTLRAVISHGDLLCVADHGYQQFRSLVRRTRFCADFLRLPLSTRRTLAKIARAGSREHTRQQRSEILDVSASAVAAAFRAGNCDLLIHGHTHRPGIHRQVMDGQPTTRIVLGDWYEQGSCLALDSSGYELLSLPRQP